MTFPTVKFVQICKHRSSVWHLFCYVLSTRIINTEQINRSKPKAKRKAFKTIWEKHQHLSYSYSLQSFGKQPTITEDQFIYNFQNAAHVFLCIIFRKDQF